MYPSRATSSRWLSAVLAVATLLAAVAFAFAASSRGLEVLPPSRLAHRGDNLLRLHVIAHSDAPEDQRAKLKVRDAVLAELAGWRPPADPGQWERWVSEREDALVGVATRVLRELGHDHPVRIESGAFAFPATEWNGELYPAGEYRAVRIVIGDGAGANWWCVLFPPLCFVEETEELPSGSVAHAQQVTDETGLYLLSDGRGASDKPWAAHESVSGLVAGPPAEGGERSETGDRPEGGISWRLRIWEKISDSAVAGLVKELVGASWDLAKRFSPAASDESR